MSLRFPWCRPSGVTVATAHRVLATLRSALNAAVREKLIGDSPARYLKLPPVADTA
jgi:hypothetical protein